MIMLFFSSLLKRMAGRPQSQRSLPRRSAQRFRPHLEPLEGRDVPSTLTVTSALDGDIAGDGTLRGEIAAAQSGDTIAFDSSLVGQTISISGEIKIGANINIQGPGASKLTIAETKIGYLAAPRLFEVAANAKVTLSGLTLTGGGGTAYGYVENSPNDPLPYDEYGGAILNFGTLTINDSTLTGNAAGAYFATSSAFYGGAIYNAGTLAVNNSVLSGNSASVSDISSFAGFGGAIYNTGSLTIAGSTVSDNRAYGGDGGAIVNGGTMSVSASTLSGNSALRQGGAILNGGTLTVTGGTIANNSAQYGGGIESAGYKATVVLTGVTLSGNTAYDGGALWNGGTMSLSGCTVTSNTATDAGGGIYNDKRSHLTIQSNSTVTGNSALVGADLDSLGSVKISKDSTVGLIGP
jgi:hypothetical protein